MSHWNYRVVKKHFEPPYEKEFRYGIHEVYYDDEGRISMLSVESMDPHGESLEEIKTDLENMMKAFDKPELDFETAVDPKAKDLLDFKSEDLLNWDEAPLVNKEE